MPRRDTLKVQVEEVNRFAKPFPVAKCRDIFGFGIISVDLSAGPIPIVGELWWVNKQIGKWRLDSLASRNHSNNFVNPTLGNTNNTIEFTISELKVDLEYMALVRFNKLVLNAFGALSEADTFMIEWVPCNKAGDIIDGESIRQKVWIPSPETPIDSNGWYAVQLGPILRPKVWHWKVRVMGIRNNTQGLWNEWSEPVMPFNTGMPLPPHPILDVGWRVKTYKIRHEYQALITFQDVGWWAIDKYDEQDGIKEYNIEMQPLVLTQTWDDNALDNVGAFVNVKRPKGITSIGPDIEIASDKIFKRVIKKDAPVHRATVKDIDEDEDALPDDAELWTPLGTLIDNPFPANPTGIDEFATTILVQEGTFNPSNFVDLVPPLPIPDPFVWPIDEPEGNIIIRMNNEQHVVSTEGVPSTDYEEMYVSKRTARPEKGSGVYEYEISRAFSANTESARDRHLEGSTVEIYYPDNKYTVTFKDIPKPKSIWWRARARSVDRLNRKGEWSEWTYPTRPSINTTESPAPDALDEDAVPVYAEFNKIRLKFDTIAGSNILSIRWNEIAESIIENSDNTPLSRYQVDLAASDGYYLDDNIPDRKGKKVVSANWDDNGTPLNDTDNFIKYKTETAHGLSVGDYVRVEDMSPNEYNGYFIVDDVVDATTFKVVDTSGTTETDYWQQMLSYIPPNNTPDSPHIFTRLPTKDPGRYGVPAEYTVIRRTSNTIAVEHTQDTSIFPPWTDTDQDKPVRYGTLANNINKTDVTFTVNEVSDGISFIGVDTYAMEIDFGDITIADTFKLTYNAEETLVDVTYSDDMSDDITTQLYTLVGFDDLTGDIASVKKLTGEKYLVTFRLDFIPLTLISVTDRLFNMGELDNGLYTDGVVQKFVSTEGFIITIDDEEMVVTERVQNIKGIITPLGDTITLTGGVDLNNLDLNFFIRIDNELMLVIDINGNNFEVVRGQMNTALKNHNADTENFVYQYPYDRHIVSTKNDNDADKFADTLYRNIENNWWYQSRVRLVDLHNRTSRWSKWSDQKQQN